MEQHETLAADIFKAAETITNEVRELQGRLARIYTLAASLRNLSLDVARQLNPEPTTPKDTL